VPGIRSDGLQPLTGLISAGLFSALATRLFGRRYGLGAAMVGIVAYTALVGAGPSVVRAAIPLRRHLRESARHADA
jgi:hypothetical protein